MSKRKPSGATRLVDLALKAGVELFHTAEKEVYAVIPAGDDRRETWAVRGRDFKLWLAGLHYRAGCGAANAQTVSDALTVLEAQGRAAVLRTVFTRMAEVEGVLYLDLADEEWRTVEVDSDGWRVRRDSPVRFRRPRGMRALPVPKRRGRLDELREFINVDDDGWLLIAAWLVGTLRPDRPFPILALHGEPGGAKSTQGGMLRSLVDPNVALLRSPPREEVDLILQARNGWIVGYDNLSSIPEWLSDALCRVSTGAGLGRRQLYTDDEETLISLKRPIVYTAVGELAARGDLNDRVLSTILPKITETNRRTEDDVWAAFRAAQPHVLGALLDAAVSALARLPATTLPRIPRMADFATWVTAAEPGLGWEPGTFFAVNARSQETAHDLTLEASLVGQAILGFMKPLPHWTGNAKALLAELEPLVDERTRRDRDWPATPKSLSGKLRMIAPDLLAKGLEVEYERGGGLRARFWTLTWAGTDEPHARDDRGTVPGEPESAGKSDGYGARDGRDAEIPLPLRNGDRCWRCDEVGCPGTCP